MGGNSLLNELAKLVLSTLSAVAEMERDLLVERTNAGLARARAEGKTLGRPKVTNEKSATEIRAKLISGTSVDQHSLRRCGRHRQANGSPERRLLHH